ncbi:radical SAM protein [bacterium]|nr:radical SAM protein [bacterium]
MKPHLFSLLPQDLVNITQDLPQSITLAEASRLQAHVLGDGKMDFTLRRPIRKSLQEVLSQNLDTSLLKIIERIEDPADKSVRYLFESHDGSLIEAVKIPLLKPGHYSVCLSSQVGCAMKCDFCATGRLGFKRNLEVWEMIAQFWQIRAETDGRLSGAVFMGQGEPFNNYANVIKTAQLLNSPSGCRVDSKNITISTVGLVPQIKKYTEENHPYRLIVSLTSAVLEKRKQMLPVAAGYSLEELATVLKAYGAKRKERLTLAWVLIRGFNSGMDEVEALKKLMGDTPYKLNLIDVNDARPQGYKRADDAERKAFQMMLQDLKVPIVRRYSVGNARHSACGMLAGKRLNEIEEATYGAK